MTFDFVALQQFIGFVVVVALAAIWVRSALVKQHHRELEELVETRGNRISDLKAQIDRQGAEIKQLQAKVTALDDLFTSDIAERVAAKVLGHIEATT